MFRGAKHNILYIGKATALKDRVASYLSKSLLEARGPLIVKMLEEARSITHIETDSVLEALLLEAHLIKKYEPPYNTRDKDNKSWSYVIITNEAFPRIFVERGRTLPETYGEGDVRYEFGPFSSGTSLRNALKIIRKLFPYRDRCIPLDELNNKNRARPCFNAELGLCPGVCVGKVTREEYARTIQNIRLFFEGKKKSLVRSLEAEMKRHARSEDFEKADDVKRTLFSLRHISDTALLSLRDEVGAYDREGVTRIEAYDISHLGGTDTVGVMVVLEDGHPKKNDYRRFKVRAGGHNDLRALEEVLLRRKAHNEWRAPDIVVTDGGIAQLRVAEGVFGRESAVVSVVKDERHKPKKIIGGNREVIRKHKMAIILANAEAHRFAIAFQKMRRSKSFFSRKSEKGKRK
jgi:excinuclease ABC subunit C